MIEYMLASVIFSEFDRSVGKNQADTKKALHVGFRLNVGNSTHQYRVSHMYLFAPFNYVHVAVQSEHIDEEGERHVGKMKHLCYHDSCWRDAVQTFIFENRHEMGGFQSLSSLFGWCDILELKDNEVLYLDLLDVESRVRHSGSDHEKNMIAQQLQSNPFSNRSVWAKQI